MLSPRAAAAFFLAATLPLKAQDSTHAGRSHVTSVLLIGSPAEDRARVDQLRGRYPLAGSLIRSPSASSAGTDSGFHWAFIRPTVDGTYNSQLPYSVDDGSLWAGRGLSTRLTTGIRANVGRVQIQLAPEIMHVANGPFAFLPSEIPGRSSYALRLHTGPLSIDLPVRFGADPFTLVTPGQSALWIPITAVDVGVSTENQWWGPAIQNSLIMSNNAAGIPQVFIRTKRPIRTRIGDFEAKGIIGGLTESLYFDADSTNDRRSISGVVATFTPRGEPNLAIGAARVVYSPAPRSQSIARHATDAVLRWSTTRPDSTHVGSDTFDQLFSLFGRWVFPASGVEIYAEWARMLPPVSLRDWLVAPQYTQGYTLGMQAARELRGSAVLRFQAELTDLEQTPASRAGDTLSYYTSRSVPQGYTQRGQSIGAAVGPGGSSQLLAVDYMPRAWDVGIFAERIRWDNDVYYLQPTGMFYFSHDVTVLAGVRGTRQLRGRALHVEYSASQRLSFMFQNLRGGFGPQRENDFHNHSLRFWLTL